MHLVLSESGRSPIKPKVTLLPPAEEECVIVKKKKDKRKTLVCVAKGFYPDHVSVSWQVNGNAVSDGVATDGTAKQVGKFYSITSRLRVLSNSTSRTNVTCHVSFFNGTHSTDHSAKLVLFPGQEQEETISRAQYLKVTHGGKLCYTLLLTKSSLYGVLLVLLLWKLQGSDRKQS